MSCVDAPRDVDFGFIVNRQIILREHGNITHRASERYLLEGAIRKEIKNPGSESIFTRLF